MDPTRLWAEVELTVEFFDVDSMQVVWHGNYLKYMERARCALLDKIGYNYQQMLASGYAWPVVEARLKYIRPLVFGQSVRVRATLVDYENRLKLAYRIYDPRTDGSIFEGHSVQMAVDARTRESCFASPRVAVERIEAALQGLGER
jgi:acyl-CoA thioester hydrolase